MSDFNTRMGCHVWKEGRKEGKKGGKKEGKKEKEKNLQAFPVLPLCTLAG